MKEGVGRSGSPIERSSTSFPAASASWRFRSSSAKRYRGKDWSRMLFSSGAAMNRRYRGEQRESRTAGATALDAKVRLVYISFLVMTTYTMSVEDYLKAIYELSRATGSAVTTEVASR